VSAAQDALAALPDNPEIVEALGTAQQTAGDSNQALATFSKLASLRPDSPVPYVRLAEVQGGLKDYNAALESLNKALAIKPDLLEAQRGLIMLELVAGRVQPALAVAHQVQKQRPQESVGYVLEGDIYVYGKEWKKAAAAYRSGLKQTPTSSELAAKLHLALAAGGDPEAPKFAASWRKDHPKDTLFLQHLAQDAMARKDYASALETYRTLSELTPNNATLLNNLAWAAKEAKDPSALQYAEQAHELAPNQPWIMDTLGTMLVDKGDAERGLALLQKAAAMAPETASIRLHLAQALIKTGQKDAAKRELDALTKLGDKFPAQAEVMYLKKGL